MDNNILRDTFFLLPLLRRASVGKVTDRSMRGDLYMSFRCPLHRGQLHPRCWGGEDEESRGQCSWVVKRRTDGSFSPLLPTNPFWLWGVRAGMGTDQALKGAGVDRNKDRPLCLITSSPSSHNPSR